MLQPQVGDLIVSRNKLGINSAKGQFLIIFHAQPGTSSAHNSPRSPPFGMWAMPSQVRRHDGSARVNFQSNGLARAVGVGVAEPGGGPVAVRGADVHDPGYDAVTGPGSPGPAFFRSSGSRPK